MSADTMIIPARDVLKTKNSTVPKLLLSTAMTFFILVCDNFFKKLIGQYVTLWLHQKNSGKVAPKAPRGGHKSYTHSLGMHRNYHTF